MIIQDAKTIRDIQHEFQGKFPGLKIEFYEAEHGDHQGSRAANQYDPSKVLRDIRQQHAEGDLVVYPEMTIAQLERNFEELFGLHVQVFRRSKSLWLQTISTDGWTLEKQNRKGLHSNQVN